MVYLNISKAFTKNPILFPLMLIDGTEKNWSMKMKIAFDCFWQEKTKYHLSAGTAKRHVSCPMAEVINAIHLLLTFPDTEQKTIGTDFEFSLCTGWRYGELRICMNFFNMTNHIGIILIFCLYLFILN